MKRPLVAAVAAASVVVSAAVVTATALSQGGDPPAGTLVVKTKLTDAPGDHGFNAATPRNKKRPVVGDMVAGTGAVISGKGRGYDFQVVTYPGPHFKKKYKGGSATIGLTMYDFTGGDRLWLSCLREDAPRDNPCTILGGTGRYAGARGTAVESNFKTAKHSQTFITTFSFTT